MGVTCHSRQSGELPGGYRAFTLKGLQVSLKTKLRLSKAARRAGSKDPFINYTPSKHAKEGGLNAKYRARYNRETGSNLQAPVTGKVKAGSKDAKRRKSFCARMGGVKGPTSKGGKLTPKGAALKRWRC